SLGTSCAIFIREDDELLSVATALRSSEHEFHTLDVALTSQMRNVLAKGTSEFVRDGIIVPLPSRGRIAGALFLGCNTVSFDHEDLRLLEEVGRRAGMSLENSRLYQETQISSRLKDEFVAALSHELRTPLTPILGAVYMLRTEPDNKRIFAKALDLIERNAKAQSKIVEDLLDVSRIINGKLRLNLEPVDLHTTIQTA